MDYEQYKEELELEGERGWLDIQYIKRVNIYKKKIECHVDSGSIVCVLTHSSVRLFHALILD